MNRRNFLRRLAAGATVAAAGGLAGCDLSLEHGMKNPCLAALPRDVATHPLLRAAWAGVTPAEVIDSHVHLFGNGDSGRGLWVNPAMESLLYPMQFAQRLFYMNAGCIHDAPGEVDRSVVERLRNLHDSLAPGWKSLLFAFDWACDESGKPVRELSTFHVPNDYARDLARQYPDRFEWAASIHPYRPDAVDLLEQAAAEGARAVKWLPAAHAIDPAHPKCARFFAAAARLQLPIITHAGEEKAVRGGDRQAFGNPLKLRAALDAGVRIVIAHCASLGSSIDLDRGAAGPVVDAFELFARLMDEQRSKDRLFADISAITQLNRIRVLPVLLRRDDWHPRLLNGSDYPLPGVMPLISLNILVQQRLLAAEAVPVLRTLREHNPILFDFVLKRALNHEGRRFPVSVFHTRRFFRPATA